MSGELPSSGISMKGHPLDTSRIVHRRKAIALILAESPGNLT